MNQPKNSGQGGFYLPHRRFSLRLLVIALLTFVASAAFAQGKLTGTVVDDTGQPVVGASVQIKGTNIGAITDLDGRFTIQNSPAKGQLVVSYIGFKSQTLPLGKTSYEITLKEDYEQLDELVVVGYGVQRKSDVTGALTRVNAEELNSRPVNNAFEALQGKAAGVDITTSERPGTLGSILIRGTRSISASSAPLYVVDGIPLQTGGIESLNPQDIESIDILKDASSTAIYGSRGANGVILVTTKRGQEGKMKINYNGSMTFDNIVDKMPAMKASDYITWRRWAFHNSNPEKYNPGNQPNYEQDQAIFTASGDDTAYNNVMSGWNADHTVWDGSKVVDTDWTDFVTRTGVTQEHTLSVSGGSKNMNSMASVGYLNNQGTQRGQSYERYNISTATDIKATKWFTMGGSINASYAKQHYGLSRTGQVQSSSGPIDLYSMAKSLLRYSMPYDSEGNLITSPGGSIGNFYTVMDEWNKSIDNRETFRALGSFYATIDFGNIWAPLQGLQFKSQFGPDFRYYRMGNFIDSSSSARAGSDNYARRNDQRDFAWTWDNMIMYNRTFDVHNVGVTLLHSASKSNTETSSMSETGIVLPSFMWNNMGAIDITNSKFNAGMGTGLTEQSLESYMARVNYSFNDRYLLTVSGRWDGSSVLAKGNQWEFFPSAALGWRMEQEEWLKDVKWVDQLKLRLGYGVTGNAAVSPYGTLGVISSYWMPFSTGNSQILVTNEPYYSKGSNQMPNKQLGWEKTSQFNVGVDFSFLHGRLGGTIDVYTSKTNDLLLSMSVPSLTGYPSMMANIGKTSNRGVELTLNTIPVMTHGFVWNSNLNFAWQKDKIDELANGKEDDINNAWFIGESISVYYGIEGDGIWQESDAEEMAKFNEKGAKFEVGKVKPVDQNGDYVIDNEDRVIIGNRNPRFTAGWSNTFSWKGLELTVELNGRFGYKVDVGGQGQYGMFNQSEISYWTPENTGADWQKPIYNQAGGDQYSSLLGFKDASFIKLRNLSLGYNFDRKLLERIGLSNLKLYVQGRNLGMLYSSYKYMDLDTGQSYFNRGFTVGLQVGF